MRSYWFFIGPFRLLCVLMDLNGSLFVFMDFNES